MKQNEKISKIVLADVTPVTHAIAATGSSIGQIIEPITIGLEGRDQIDDTKTIGDSTDSVTLNATDEKNDEEDNKSDQGEKKFLSSEEITVNKYAKDMINGGHKIEMNKSHARQYFQSLYPVDVSPLGYLILWTSPKKEAFPFRLNEIEQAVEKAVSLSSTEDVYCEIGLQREVPSDGQGTVAGVKALPGLWMEIGIQSPKHKVRYLPPTLEDALSLINKFPLKPSVIVHTGDGICANWLFENPWVFQNGDLDYALQLSKNFQDTFFDYGEKNGWYLNETAVLTNSLRIPGTLNHKQEQLKPVEILEFHRDRRYPVDKFIPHLISSPGDPNNPCRDKLVNKLNMMFALSVSGNKSMILQKIYDQTKKIFTEKLIGINSFKNLISHYPKVHSAENGKRKVTLASKHWLEHEHRRTYNNVIFTPKRIKDPSVFNCWKGLSIKPIQGNCQMLLDHIREIICNRNPQYFDYFVKWLAHGVQKPYEKPETAIVVIGKQGTGKSIIGKAIAKLFDPHSKHFTRDHHLTGYFNEQLRNLLFIVADEASLAGNDKVADILKGLISEPTITIIKLGNDAENVDCYLRVMILSNHDNVIKADSDDRRYFVLRASNNKRLNFQYFSDLSHEIYNGGLEAFFCYLLNIDISDFNPREVPKTEELLNQKLHSLDPIGTILYEKLLEGKLMPHHDEWEEVIDKDLLYLHFLDESNRVGKALKMTKPVFSKKIKQYLKSMGTTYKQESNARKHYYKFPSLDVCRKDFEVKLGGPINWSPEVEESEITTGEIDNAIMVESEPSDVVHIPEVIEDDEEEEYFQNNQAV